MLTDSERRNEGKKAMRYVQSRGVLNLRGSEFGGGTRGLERGFRDGRKVIEGIVWLAVERRRGGRGLK